MRLTLLAGFLIIASSRAYALASLPALPTFSLIPGIPAFPSVSTVPAAVRMLLLSAVASQSAGPAAAANGGSSAPAPCPAHCAAPAGGPSAHHSSAATAAHGVRVMVCNRFVSGTKSNEAIYA
jgi:hypothetical protein